MARWSASRVTMEPAYRRRSDDLLPPRRLSQDTVWEWAEAILRMLMCLMLAAMEWITGVSVPGGGAAAPSTARPSASPSVAPPAAGADSGRGTAAGAGARPKRKAAAKPVSVPEPKLKREDLPDEKAMRRWGRKKCDFGKEVKGMTFKEALEQKPDHAKWVRQNVKQESTKNFGEVMQDYANYLRTCKAIEEAELVSDETSSEDQGAAEKESDVSSMELVPDQPEA